MYLNPFQKQRIIQRTWLKIVVLSILLLILMLQQWAMARTIYAPWQHSMYPQQGYESLIYGSSTLADVQRTLGRAPDDWIRAEQMYPIVDNYYYYGDNGEEGATVFVFENGYLVGLHYMTASRQLVDLTYMLPNSGDRILNSPFLAGYQSYFRNFPFVTWR